MVPQTTREMQNPRNAAFFRPRSIVTHSSMRAAPDPELDLLGFFNFLSDA
jgi:hypothetical protein